MALTMSLGFALLFCISPFITHSQISYKKFGDGIKFQAADSTGLIKMSARIQNLLVVKSDLDGTDPITNAMVRRARLKFDGFAYSTRITYKIELGLSNRDISNSRDASLVGGSPKIILDAVVKYEFVKGHTLWFGQTKLPGNRERVISSQKLQFVDRSLVNSNFNIDRDFGLQLHHKFKLGNSILKFAESISLGEGRNNIKTNNGGFDYTGRTEFLPFGEFTNKGDYFSSDLAREESIKASLGFTFDFNHKAIRQGGQLGSILTDTNGAYYQSDLTSFMGDIYIKYKGFSFLTEATYRESSLGNFISPDGLAYNQGFGLSTQAGYLLKSDYEMAIRYSRISPIKGMSAASVNYQDQYTFGISKYIMAHNLKFQTDLTYHQDLGNTFVSNYLMFRFQTELSF